MARLVRVLVLLATLTLSSTVLAQSSLRSMVERLENGSDFRVRVQAALELGKSKTSKARPPLEGALDDENAAVRAAAAAALKVLGDPRAIKALKKHRKDSSAAVRSQIKAAIKALRGAEEKERAQKVEILIEVGKMRNGAGRASRKMVRQFEKASRSKLGDLPGVEVIDRGKSSKAASKSRKLPVVKVTGRLSKLKRTREGSSVVYSARVEFVVHKMPESAIRGTVSGTARASASASTRSTRGDARLMKEALMSAIDSALKRAPDALRAALK